jgi:hypothetical protein
MVEEHSRKSSMLQRAEVCQRRLCVYGVENGLCICHNGRGDCYFITVLVGLAQPTCRRHEFRKRLRVQLRKLSIITFFSTAFQEETTMREARHQEMYLEMYNKGMDSAKFERLDEVGCSTLLSQWFLAPALVNHCAKWRKMYRFVERGRCDQHAKISSGSSLHNWHQTQE